MKLLVTGGLGYVGGRLSALLAQQAGVELTLTTRRAVAVAPWAPLARVVVVDPGDVNALDPLCAEADIVVHLAGMNAADSKRAGDAAVEARARDISAVLRAAVARRVRRLVYVSTAHVYGPALVGVVDESTPPQPVHPYAASHLAAEEILRAAAVRGEIEGVIARLSNSFGAPADASADCWTLALNDLCRQAVSLGRIKLLTTGLQRRDFIAMSEVCRALAHLCRVPLKGSRAETFNVGSGTAASVFELAERIAARVAERRGARPPIETGPEVDTVGTSPLQFCVTHLRDAGFAPDPVAGDAELDRLIDFCAGSAPCCPADHAPRETVELHRKAQSAL